MAKMIELEADATPLLGFLELLKTRAEFADGSLSLDDLGFELVRFEQNIDAADTGKIFITFYPSDAFMRYVAALFTFDGDGLAVE